MSIKKVYFDNAATTPVDESSIEAVLSVMKYSWGNPSSTHAFGRTSRSLLERARRQFANDFDVDPAEIFFTSGATESITIAFHSACKEGVKHIITVSTEHKAVLDAANEMHIRHNIPLTILPVNQHGAIDLSELSEALQLHPGKALVAIMYVNNETGVIHPLKEIGEMVSNYNGLFFCDCVQAALYQDIKPKAQFVDYFSLSAHKIYGPKGVGLLYINKAREKHALWRGGSQERSLRPGTENIPGIAGFTAAWEKAQKNKDTNQKKVQLLANRLLEGLSQIKGAKRNGTSTASHIVHLSIPSNKSTSAILLEFDLAGVALSAGSACQSGSHQRSHVVEAMGLPKGYVELRISIGKQNTEDDIDYLLTVLHKIAAN